MQAMAFCLESRLAAAGGDRRRLVEHAIRVALAADADQRAGIEREVIGTQQGGTRDGVRGQPLLHLPDADFGLAELDHRPAAQWRGPLELLRAPVAAAQHGELLARFERLARRPE